MEHIIPIAIAVDDETITKNVMAHAEKVIIDDIEKAVANKIFKSQYYHKDAKLDDPLSEFSSQIVREWLDKNEENIIDKAADKLVEYMKRTSAVKQAIAKAIEEN